MADNFQIEKKAACWNLTFYANIYIIAFQLILDSMEIARIKYKNQ